MEGKSVTLTIPMLQALANAYSPRLHEAPLVIGHPEHDAPAYGWVTSLTFSDGALQAETSQCNELRQLIDAGHYKKVSASFYEPDAEGNPTPTKYYLRHVGFLGAIPPSIKGLRAVSFAGSTRGVVTFGIATNGGAGAQSNRQIADRAIAYQKECRIGGRHVSAAEAVAAVSARA